MSDLASKALEWYGVALTSIAGLALSALLVIDLSNHVGRYLALSIALSIGVGSIVLATHLRTSDS